MIDLKFTFKGKQYSGVLSNVMGAGNNSTHFLMVDKIYYGQIWKTDVWRYGGPLDEIGTELAKVMEQIEHAKGLLIPEALEEIATELDLMEIDHDTLATWWQNHGWIFYPVDRGEIVKQVAKIQHFTTVKMRNESSFFTLQFEVHLKTLPSWN